MYDKELKAFLSALTFLVWIIVLCLLLQVLAGFLSFVPVLFPFLL